MHDNKSRIQRLQTCQICRNIINSSCYLIHLESSQQSAHKGLLNNKMLLFIILYKEHNYIIKSETMFNNIDIISFFVYNIKHKE